MYLKNTPIEAIWEFINPMMLYGRHLGMRGAVVRQIPGLSKDLSLRKKIKEEDFKAFELWEAVEGIKMEYGHTPFMVPSAVYRFYRASSEGNSILLWDEKGKSEKMRFVFSRAEKEPGLCLSDFVHPDVSRGDNLGIFVVSVGKSVRIEAERLKSQGAYLKSHILQILALESAEAYAEFLHSQMRRQWGFQDPPALSMLERFQGKYQGKRYSFGYPACPELADQEKLFSLLSPKDIGVELTDGYMMDPEASVSAVVFHHPQASYFSIGRGA